MKRTWLQFAVLFLFVAGLLASPGCRKADVAAASGPAVLRLAFVPQQDQEERYQAAYTALRSYLLEAMAMPVEVLQLDNANAALEAMRAHKLDVCNFSPWPFLIAEQKAGAEAFLVTGAPDGRPVSYHTLLIAHASSGLKTVADIKRRSRELVFSFEEPVSTSGHLVPRAFFHREAGINPEQDFKQTLFSADSTISILAVKARRIDVAAVSDSGLRRNIAMGRVPADEITILWESDPVLSNVMAIRRDLPPGFKARLRAALIALPAASPATWAHVVRQYSNPVSSYLPATDTILAPYREMVRTVPGLQVTL